MNINEVKYLIENINQTNNILTKEQYIECYKVINEEVNNHGNEELINLIIILKKHVITNDLYSSLLDIVLMNLLIIRNYMYNNHAWRARSYVNDCFDYFELIKFDSDYMLGAEIYKILGNASSCYLDCRTAMKCYGMAVQLYLKTDYPLKYIAMIARSMIISIKQLPQNEQQLPSDEEIMDMFKEYADPILKAKAGFGYIKHDPVEQTKEFQEIYDEIMEEVEIEFNKHPVHSCHYRWNLMKDALARRNIKWRSIALMNPRVKFD